MVKNLGCDPLVIHLPIGTENDFAGIVDLISFKALIWSGEELGAKWTTEDIPEDMLPLATVRDSVRSLSRSSSVL